LSSQYSTTSCPDVFSVVRVCPGSTPRAQAQTTLGPRAGFGDESEFYLGAQLELPAKFGSVSLVPSLDFGPGTDASSVANADFRLYLVPLPDTGIRFYAAAGPTMMLSGDLELGISLSLGLNIPMKASRRYNVEYRYGLGDIPEHKIGLAVMFGL